MSFLVELFTQDSVAHAVVIIGLVAALGLAIGNIKIFGISLGIAGVLFAGLIFGHYNLTLNEEVLDFARDFGLILFVYTIGLQVGPGFIASLRRQGLALNLMAAAIVGIGVIVTLGLVFLAHIDIKAAVGLYTGGVTNTPGLGAAQQALKDLPGITDEASKMPGLGYAIAYPFGIVGTILSMLLVRRVFRVDTRKEADAVVAHQSAETSGLIAASLQVSNKNLEGVRLQEVPGLGGSGVVVSRILHDDRMQVADATTTLAQGDVLLAVGPREKLRDLRLIVGEESDVDLRAVPSHLSTRRLRVTKSAAIGKSILELALPQRFGVQITRVNRAEFELPVTADFKLQFADTVTVVGDEQSLDSVSRELGNSVSKLNHPQLISVFLGITLGVILGSVPISIPGMPAPVKLGLAGGPLIVAILLSRVGQIGPVSMFMPISANFMLRQIGIVLFLACVGLKAGDQFVQTLTQGAGFAWMGWATLITLLPLLVVALVARAVYRLNFVSLCGLLAGSMTDPPALAFATSVTGSEGASVAYATVYPLVMILRVISAQVLVLWLAR
ncbi:MAG: putative transporter [Armatimonadetes bacterium]|nr:putative transporter [Armatimonadota bacterium]